mgnify:CR=1 FL=1
MEEIKNFKKDSIKQSTLSMYVNNLNKLKELFNVDSYEFLESPEDVFDKIKNLRFTTQKTYFNSVIVYLQAIDADPKLIKTYQQRRDEYAEQYNKDQESGVISDKQKNNFATTEEIESMVKVMKKSLNSIKKSNRVMVGNDFELYQAYMMFSIYLKLPLRNDVAGMISIKASDFKKLKDNTEINYIILGKSKIELVLNDYKTNKNYGQKIIEVEDQELKRLIRQYVKLVGFGVMFKRRDGSPMNRNNITQILIKYSEKYMGKRVSTTLLAKAYLSGKYASVPQIHKEMAKDANVRGHSVETQQKIYNKSTQ